MMKTVMPEERIEMKILYEDGNLDMAEPYTCSAELRKWDDSYRVDYVLLRSFVNSIVYKEYKNFNQYEKVDERFILYANSDGEAIGKAVDSFRELKKRCEKKVRR